MRLHKLAPALVLALGLALGGTASAFDSGQSGFNQQQQQQQQPSLGQTYDSQSGNQYRTQPNAQGGTTTRGSNARTGSTWSNSTDSQGNQSGVDSSGNRWEYNQNTGTYRNHGTGEIRQHGQ